MFLQMPPFFSPKAYPENKSFDKLFEIFEAMKLKIQMYFLSHTS